MMTLQKRIWSIAGMLMFSIGALAFISNLETSRLLSDLDDVTKNQLPALKNMTYADMMHDGLRGVVMNAFVAASDHDAKRVEELGKEAGEKVGQFNVYIENLEKLNLTAGTRSAIDTTKIGIKAYGEMSVKTVDLLNKGKMDEAKSGMKEFETSFETLEGQLENLGALIDSDAGQSHKSGKNAAFIVNVFSLLSLTFGAIFAFWNIRVINRNLKNLTQDLTSVGESLGEVTSSVGFVSSTVASSSLQQAAAITQSTSALHEIGELALKTNESAKVSLQKVLDVSELTMQGEKVLDRLEKAMVSLEDSNQKLQGISGTIDQIEKKTSVINDIVFKTELLSFNASIEAARAGAEGRGFAVVAEEVGSLSKMSGEAAKNIENLLGSSKSQVHSALGVIRERVDEGHQISMDVRKTFSSISESVMQIREYVEGTSQSVQSQSAGIQQTSKAVTELEEMSKKSQNAAVSAQKASDVLTIENGKLEDVTLKLKRMFFGASALSVKPNEKPAVNPSIADRKAEAARDEMSKKAA